MNKDNTITFNELEIFFTASCKGFARYFHNPMLSKNDLREIALSLFFRYDFNKNYSLETDE